jgi:phage protein U
MKQLPDEQTLAELLEMGKNLEQQAKKVYLMTEGMAQKYEHKLRLQRPTNDVKSPSTSTQTSVREP